VTDTQARRIGPDFGDASTHTSPPAEAAAPRLLNGRYELHGLLGYGGMAEVHRGFDRVLRREVAVKIMHSALVETAERRRFTAETRLLARLNDSHLVTLLDAGVDEAGSAPRPWFVMELVTGPALSVRLLDGPLSPSQTARVGADVALGLAHAHALGVVHRDVKPANVLLTETGSAKLTDFGVARAIGDTHTLTGAGYTIGTAAYLSPEQVSGEPVTGAGDVYALGLVLLEALTGRRAYPGSPVESAFARLHHNPAIPVSLGPGWTRLLTQMTAFEPEHRPSAAEVATRLLSQEHEDRAPMPLDAPAESTVSVSPPPARADLEDQKADLAIAGAVPGLASDAAASPPPTGRDRARLPALAMAAVLALLLVAVAAWSTHAGHGSPAAAAGTSAGSSQHPSTSKSRPSGTSQTSPARRSSASHSQRSTTTVATRSGNSKRAKQAKQQRHPSRVARRAHHRHERRHERGPTPGAAGPAQHHARPHPAPHPPGHAAGHRPPDRHGPHSTSKPDHGPHGHGPHH
jgi:eukaryotic-like serine/threonine-protein kinase